LSKALREAMRHGLASRNVCTLERAPRLVAEEMTILSPEQVNNLPALLHGHPLEAPAIVALFTGMRRGEILALRWRNLDLDEEMIRVRESLEETKAGLRFKPPKSKARARDIRLPAIVCDALEAHRKRDLERRLHLMQGRPNGDDLVFPAWHGGPWSPNVFGAAWSKLTRELGIKVSFHGLRHTHASMLIAQGVDMVTVSKRLGHSSPVVTMGVYAHLHAKDDAKAAEAINAAIRG
jgi:integrase